LRSIGIKQKHEENALINCSSCYFVHSKQAVGVDSTTHTISRKRPAPRSDRKAATTRAAAVQKHRVANSPASQAKAAGNRQNRTKDRMVSVPSMMPAA